MEYEYKLLKSRTRHRLLQLPNQFPSFTQSDCTTPNLALKPFKPARFTLDLAKYHIPDLTQENLAHKNSKEIALEKLKNLKSRPMLYQAQERQLTIQKEQSTPTL